MKTKRFKVDVEVPATAAEFIRDLPTAETLPMMVAARQSLDEAQVALRGWETNLADARAKEPAMTEVVAGGRQTQEALDELIRRAAVAERMIPACQEQVRAAEARLEAAKAEAAAVIIAHARGGLARLNEALTAVVPVFAAVSDSEDAMRQAVRERTTPLLGYMRGWDVALELPQLSWPG